MKRFLQYCIPLLITCYSHHIQALSSLAKNDPYPVYTSVYDPYLTAWTKEWLKGHDTEGHEMETFSFSASPFIQKAKNGRDFDGIRRPLGDLEGRWNMLALTYGPVPTGQTLDDTQLGFAKQSIFSDIPQLLSNVDLTLFTDPDAAIVDTRPTSSLLITDTLQLTGFFSVPLRYRKVGFRFELSVNPFCDIGFTVQGGVSEIKQTFTHFLNLTDIAVATGQVPASATIVIPLLNADASAQDCPSPSFPPESGCTTPIDQIQAQLMNEDKAFEIFKELNLETCDFEETSIEDFRFILWWRHIAEVNRFRDSAEWAKLLVIPSVAFSATVPTGKRMDRKKLFALPFGNDGHFSIAGDVGIAFDFFETMELAFNAGVTYFLPRTIENFRLPTHPLQSGVFPFATSVRVKPGLNFNFNAILHAYRFLDKLSAHVEYIFVKHEEDGLTVTDPTLQQFFIPRQKECLTKFCVHLINGALNYDISPNITLGGIGQFSLNQRNAYKSTTFMGTLRVLF